MAAVHGRRLAMFVALGLVSLCQSVAVSAQSLPSVQAEWIATLDKESLADSILNLSREDIPYHIMGESVTDTAIPRSPGCDMLDILRILQNRRFLKVHQELAALDRDQAAGVVAAAVRSSLQQYQDRFEAEITSRAGRAPRAANPADLAPTVVGGPPEHPSLTGSRYRLLSLLLAAGSLELAAANGPVLDAIAVAARQRRLLYSADGRLSVQERWELLESCSIWNTQVLGTAFLGTSPRAGELRHEAAAMGIGRIQIPLTSYDAEQIGRNDFGEVDPGRRRQTVTFVSLLGDGLLIGLVCRDPAVSHRAFVEAWFE